MNVMRASEAASVNVGVFGAIRLTDQIIALTEHKYKHRLTGELFYHEALLCAGAVYI